MAPHSLNSHIKLFQPHLEDLTLPLAYPRMSQLCPLPLCAAGAGTQLVSRTSPKPVVYAVSGPWIDPSAFIGAAGGDKMDGPLVDGGRK